MYNIPFSPNIKIFVNEGITEYAILEYKNSRIYFLLYFGLRSLHAWFLAVVYPFPILFTFHQLLSSSAPINLICFFDLIFHFLFQENDGLTVSLTAFYAASLVLALSHIHKQGIVFRDLKPENIMLDNTGYLRGKKD